MNEPLKVKLSKEIITDLNAFYHVNAVRELKKMAEDTISYAKEHFGKVYDGYEVSWIDGETLTPERLDEIEKEIDEIPEEVRQKNLQELMKKLEAQITERTPEETIEAETAKFTLEVAKD